MGDLDREVKQCATTSADTHTTRGLDAGSSNARQLNEEELWETVCADTQALDNEAKGLEQCCMSAGLILWFDVC
jgi:hypothetical protein